MHLIEYESHNDQIYAMEYFSKYLSAGLFHSLQLWAAAVWSILNRTLWAGDRSFVRG